jgi:hypothetical protein
MVGRRGSSRRCGTAIAAVALLALVIGAAACGSSATMSTTGTTATTARSGPAMTVDPATGASGGQEVVVSGTGFPAGAGIGVAQCAAGGRDQATCDASTASFATTDADGAFTATYEVRAFIGVASGLVDCSVAGACEVVAGAPNDPAMLVAVPLQVTAGSPQFAEPSCPGPYAPVGYAQDAFGEPLPPNVSGSETSARSAGASVSVQRVGDALLITLAYGGVERELTTAPNRVGSNYDRSSDPVQNLYGEFSIVTREDGATYLVLTQGNSGEYTQFGWRLDDPCAAA